jgi:ribosomal protein L11 methyltransferase
MTHANDTNPFRVPPQLWQITLHTHRDAVPLMEDALADFSSSVSSFEVSEADALWKVELVCESEPDSAEVTRRLMIVSHTAGYPMPEVVVEKLEQKDWLAEVLRTFPAFTIGRYYVYGSHITDAVPASRLPLLVDAGSAFGSGEHDTTSTCLKALDWLARSRHFRNMLDMGCGSGILALAMAKTWHEPVLAVDIDPESARVARENVALNQESVLVRVVAGNGYDAPEVGQRGKYDLIVANILARPLVKLAPALAAHLAPGGMVVLSGLLARQERMVVNAHRAQGLKLVKRITSRGWNTLILKG